MKAYRSVIILKTMSNYSLNDEKRKKKKVSYVCTSRLCRLPEHARFAVCIL